jgi:hypothetical protein
VEISKYILRRNRVVRCQSCGRKLDEGETVLRVNNCSKYWCSEECCFSIPLTPPVEDEIVTKERLFDL